MSDTTVHILWDTISGDVARSDRNPVAALNLLEEVAISLGTPLKWVGAGRAIGIAGVTARQYVEYLGSRFRSSPSTSGTSVVRRGSRANSARSTSSICCSVAHGASPDDVVENLVAIGLFRSAASTLVQVAVVPRAIAHWRSSNDREIDVVVPVERGGQRTSVEAKGDAPSRLGHARLAIRQAFEHGTVVSRSVSGEREADEKAIPLTPRHAGVT